MQACQGSLRRLNTGWIDLYLLHWRGPVPLAETLEAFRDLRNAGLIRNSWFSNFDVSDLDHLMSLPDSMHVATDQVLYKLCLSAPEFEPVPGPVSQLGLPILAYSPVEQGRILGNPVLLDIATRLDSSPVQVALPSVQRLDNISAIPPSGLPALVYENRASLASHLVCVRSWPPWTLAFPPTAAHLSHHRIALGGAGEPRSRHADVHRSM